MLPHPNAVRMVRLSILGAILIRLKACDVAYIGLREVDPEEAKIIQDLDIRGHHTKKWHSGTPAMISGFVNAA